MNDVHGSSKRVLDPVDRVAEILFGLIMVLTFTGSLSVAEAGHAEVREMLLAALGCNLAWGVIDGVFYVMGCMAERGRGLLAFRAVRQATDPQTAQRLIAGALPPVIASVLQPAEFETIRKRWTEVPEPPRHARLQAEDWLGAACVCLLVFLHVSRGDPFHVHEGHHTRAPRLQRDRDRIAVHHGLCLRAWRSA